MNADDHHFNVLLAYLNQHIDLFAIISFPGGGGGGRLGLIVDGMCELNFFKRPISKVFNTLKLYP